MRVLIAGSNNVTGHHIAEALVLHAELLGYDYSDPVSNPANMFCQNVRVPAATDVEYVGVVNDIISRFKPDVIFPSNDSDLRTLSNMINLPSMFNVRLNGFGPHTLDLLDKQRTSELFIEHGITTPRVLECIDRYPFVYRQRYVGNGRKSSMIVHSNDDFQDVVLNGQGAVLTEFISGDEFTIDVIADSSHRALAVVPRLRREVRHGMVHFGEVVKDDLVIEKTIELTRKLKLTGVNCVQCIRTPDDAFFFEVNCRAGSGTSLSTAAGVNMPLAFLKMVEGTLTSDFQLEPDWGMKMIRYTAGWYFK